MSWSEPVSHFENVDFQGNVHIVRKVGEMEKLPIYLIFNSSYGNSPYAGSGFEIPILESRMWQADENRFLMKSPSGWLWIFQRTKVPNVLEGNAGWKGLIKDDTITVWAPCGDKISFKNGKIVSMQIKEDKFDYSYKANRVEIIQKNGRSILEVTNDDMTGDVSGIRLPNTREEIGLQLTGSRPQIENVAGKMVVSRVDKTLGELKKTDGTKEAFEFGVDERMNLTLKIDKQDLVWNSATKKILRDGEWTYAPIGPLKNIFDSAKMERKNLLGQKEVWNLDAAAGTETIQNVGEEAETTSIFTSGLFSGLVRKISFREGGTEVTRAKFSYDGFGLPLRFVRNNHTENYSNGKLVSLESNGRTVWRIARDSHGNPLEVSFQPE